MPAGDLLARTADHFQPVCSLSVARSSSDLQATDDLVLGHLIPVEHDEVDADAGQQVGAARARWIGRRKIEDERLIEDGVESSLLDVCLLLGNALSVVREVDFDVRVCEHHTDRNISASLR